MWINQAENLYGRYSHAKSVIVRRIYVTIMSDIVNLNIWGTPSPKYCYR